MAQMNTNDAWSVTYALYKKDLGLRFTGSRADVVEKIEAVAKARGWVVDVDAFTDQVDAYRLANKRRRRWLVGDGVMAAMTPERQAYHRAYRHRLWCRFRAAGGCGTCGEPSGRFSHCLRHRVRAAARMRKYRRAQKRTAA
jgi:hypothetical protein